MKWFWNNGWKVSKSTKRRKSWHFPGTPGTEPRPQPVQPWAAARQNAWARRLGHKYVNIFSMVSTTGISRRVFWIYTILPASLVLETTMTYSFGTLSQPLHHVNTNKKVTKTVQFGRPSVKIIARILTERAMRRKLDHRLRQTKTRHAWRPLLGPPTSNDGKHSGSRLLNHVMEEGMMVTMMTPDE